MQYRIYITMYRVELILAQICTASAISEHETCALTDAVQIYGNNMERSVHF